LSKVVQWFNNCNQSFKPSNQEHIFEIFSNPANKKLLKKINYTLLFARDFLRTGSWLACVYRVMDARGKFGEHESVAQLL